MFYQVIFGVKLSGIAILNISQNMNFVIYKFIELALSVSLFLLMIKLINLQLLGFFEIIVYLYFVRNETNIIISSHSFMYL